MTMLVFANGTMVSPQLLEGVSKGLARIICSVDAGTPETYRQIKGKPMFHKVWLSLAKYAAQAQNPDQVIAKYIVMERNRTRDEIDAFFTGPVEPV
jgi:MoaA/NifB/PqqE/SkfB family radical SAM enzyme